MALYSSIVIVCYLFPFFNSLFFTFVRGVVVVDSAPVGSAAHVAVASAASFYHFQNEPKSDTTILYNIIKIIIYIETLNINKYIMVIRNDKYNLFLWNKMEQECCLLCV